MAGRLTWAERFSALAVHEKITVALSALLAGFLIADPLTVVLAENLKKFDPELRSQLRVLTEFGRSRHSLVPAGLGILLLLVLKARATGFRRRVAYGYFTQILVFLFAAVAASGLSAALIKNTLGRARPKLFEEMGPMEFQPFTFDSDFAAFPSGHSTTAGTLAAVFAVIWPQARIPFLFAGAWVAATRFLVGSHYFTDAVAGYAFGVAFVYVMRDRLALRDWLFRRRADGAVVLRGRAVLDAAGRAVSDRLRKLFAPAWDRVKAAAAPRQ